MKLLAIDTTTDACSVSLQLDDKIVELHHVEARAHTRILLPMIRKLLDENHLLTTDLDALVLGNGPGSFIGMRISASVAQGICFGADLPLVPVSSLAAVAAEVLQVEDAEKVAVAQDARMQEVYFAKFRRCPDDLPVPEMAESIVPAQSERLLQGAGWTAAGDGWRRYPQLVSACRASLSRVSDIGVPRARFLLPLGAQIWQQGGGLAPQNLAPAYLRMTVAETTESRR